MTDSKFREVVTQIESRNVGQSERDGYQFLLNVLNQNTDKIRCVPTGTLVVGTNGKGSFCATITQILIDQNRRVGTFTSPHLESICERIRIDGEPISSDIFIQAYEYSRTFVGESELSRFEILSLMALVVFSGALGTPPVTEMILEAGIGGRKDASRALPYQQVVVTKIGLDHTEILGPTVSDIRREKLAVIHEGLKYPSVVLDPEPTQKPPLYLGPMESFKFLQKIGLPPSAELTVASKSSMLGLPGIMGRDAALLALRWVQTRGLDEDMALRSLSKVCWPGRQEFIELQDTNVLLSGDHNPQGIELLVDSLRLYHAKKMVLVVGIGLHKDLKIMLQLLKGVGCQIILTHTPFKSRQESELRPYIEKNIEFIAEPTAAFESARQGMTKTDLVVITGSLYLVGLLRSEVLKLKSQFMRVD